jgi:hypothetical protein
LKLPVLAGQCISCSDSFLSLTYGNERIENYYEFSLSIELKLEKEDMEEVGFYFRTGEGS